MFLRVKRNEKVGNRVCTTVLKYLFCRVEFPLLFGRPLSNPGLPYLRRVDPIKGEIGDGCHLFPFCPLQSVIPACVELLPPQLGVKVGLWLQHFLRLQLSPNCSGRDVFRSDNAWSRFPKISDFLSEYVKWPGYFIYICGFFVFFLLLFLPC